MESSEERQNLRRETMLKAMGIQPWHLRLPAGQEKETDQHSQADPETPSTATSRVAQQQDKPQSEKPQREKQRENQQQADPQPTIEPLPTAAVERQLIQFSWVKGATGMVLSSMGMDNAVLRLGKDIVAYGDWLAGTSGSTGQGEFQWPQLVDSGGTPQRAMQVFLDKHFEKQPESSRWLGVSSDVAEQFSAWSEELNIRIVLLPSLRGKLGDAQTKKAIWQAMVIA